MIDFSSIPSYSEFTFWFLRTSDGSYEVVNRQTNESFGVSVTEALEHDSVYYLDFANYRLRPEYAVGQLVHTDSVPISDLSDAYDKLFVGSQLIRYRREFVQCKKDDLANCLPSFDVDDYIRKVEKIVAWIHSTDFYTAPASTIYHEAFPGGLLTHTLNVYNNIIQLAILPKFSTVPIDSATVCALGHDWCKIGFYVSYEKNVKDEQTGQWHKVSAYKHDQTGIPLGHGVSSMFMLSRFVRLTADEALAIRWHMGAWRVVDSETDELQNANEKCPLVHMLQFADCLSIVQY